MELGNQIEYVMSYSIYKHDATLKMAFEAIFLEGEFLSGPPTNYHHRVVLLCMSLGCWAKVRLRSHIELRCD